MVMETPAVREDGTLKDASEMEWDYSPGQKMLPPLATPPSPIPKARKGGVQFMPTVMPSNFASTQNKRKRNFAVANREPSTSGTTKKAEVTTEGAAAIAKKKAPGAIDRVKRLNTENGVEIPEESQELEDKDVEPESEKTKKGHSPYRHLDNFQAT
jgi:hypothetical protein